MKLSTKKLIAMLLLTMFILSDAYATHRRISRSKHSLKSKTYYKNKGFEANAMAFFEGFILEMSIELSLKNKFQCLIKGNLISINNKIIDWNMREVLTIKEDYDSSMNEKSDLEAKIRLHPTANASLISSIVNQQKINFFDKVAQAITSAPIYFQKLKDKFSIWSNSKFIKNAIELIGNDYIWMIIDFIYCIFINGQSSGTSDAGYIKILIDKILGSTSKIALMISKIIEVPKLFESFIDNWYRTETDIERYQVLGKAVAGALRFMMKAVELSNLVVKK